MSNSIYLPLNECHSVFAARCADRIHVLLKKKDRTPEEYDEMINAAFAALHHCTMKGDQSSIAGALWLISRSYSSLEKGALASE
jgi:hypothetical protein